MLPPFETMQSLLSRKTRRNFSIANIYVFTEIFYFIFDEVYRRAFYSFSLAPFTRTPTDSGQLFTTGTNGAKTISLLIALPIYRFIFFRGAENFSNSNYLRTATNAKIIN